MAIDIIAINSIKKINDKYAICSTLPTGYTAKRLIRPEYKLTIEDIESKYNDRFDDPSYYYGGGGGVDGGDVGDVLGV